MYVSRSEHMDEAAVALARDILSNRVDRIDGVWRLGGFVYNTSFYDMERMGVLVGAFDRLEEVPRVHLRELWNAEAYQQKRAYGEAILARHGDAIDEALRLVAGQLQ